MCYPSNNRNNIHLNMYAKVEIPDRKFTQVDTIECDVKSFQVITAKLNCTDVQLNVFKILTAHIIYFGILQLCDVTIIL